MWERFVFSPEVLRIQQNKYLYHTQNKTCELIKYVLHSLKASLYPWAEGKSDEQDTSVFIPTPSFFGMKYRKKNPGVH